MSRFFLDTEFMEIGYARIDPLSIALVDDATGEHLYREFNDVDYKKANLFVAEHVLPFLSRTPGILTSRQIIKDQIIQFVQEHTREGQPVEFWGYYADYDWVIFAQIFGTMVDLPSGYPMYCRDLKQWCDQLGNPTLPEQTYKEHHALYDARWNREVYHFLESFKGETAA